MQSTSETLCLSSFHCLHRKEGLMSLDCLGSTEKCNPFRAPPTTWSQILQLDPAPRPFLPVSSLSCVPLPWHCPPPSCRGCASLWIFSWLHLPWHCPPPSSQGCVSLCTFSLDPQHSMQPLFWVALVSVFPQSWLALEPSQPLPSQEKLAFGAVGKFYAFCWASGDRTNLKMIPVELCCKLRQRCLTPLQFLPLD